MQEREVEVKSKNGVSIYQYKNCALHSFYISLFVRAGCMYEREGELGITHFLEHALIRNVNKLYGMKLYSMLDRQGLEFNAGTYSEMVQFYISGSSEHFRQGADIITRLPSPIVLSKEEIDSERRRIKAEIRESNDRTSLASFSGKAVFENTALSHSIVGANKDVDRMSAASLERYRKRVMTGERIFFYVTGSFTDEDIEYLLGLVDSLSLSEESTERCDNVAEVPPSFGKRALAVHIKNADYTKLRFTFDLDMTRYSIAETDLLYDMLLSGYNSKLFIELSEKRGLFYDIGGASERYKNIGTLYFTFEVKERDLYEAVALTVEILNSLKNTETVENEIIKAGYVDNALMLLDDCRELNFTFAYDNHIMSEGYATVAERRDRYEGIDARRLCEMASEIFRANNLTLTMKTCKKRADEQKIKELIGGLV